MTLTEAFWTIHSELPRQAPGSDSATRNLLRLAGGVESFKRVLVIEPGAGCSALVLAELGLEVTAIIMSSQMNEKAKNSATSKNYKIDFKTDLLSIPLNTEPYDLIWAEGSVSLHGFEASLNEWKHLLKTEGVLVITDCIWTTKLPDEETKLFWSKTYPNMLDADRARIAAKNSGFDVLRTYVLSDANWWDEYYIPLQKRHDDLRNETDPAILQAIEIGKAQINLREKHFKEYDYVGFVLKKV